jgi:formylglycine-generating enzyme required for sulfatase activity/nitrate/TMAO reductase-like tetraheme cytochrome c subunit
MKSTEGKKIEKDSVKSGKRSWKRLAGVVCISAAAGMLLMVGFNYAWVSSSKDESCMACHVHPDSEESWRMSAHYMNGSGTKTSCAECHLPPKGSVDYAVAKIKTGGKDIFSYIFKDKEKINWEAKGELEHARKIVYNESCIECHHNLFPEGISDDGVTAHLYWEDKHSELDMNCIDCHLDVGHYDPNYTHAQMTGIPQQAIISSEIFTDTTKVTSFADFVEQVPGTGVSFAMKAIPAGSFTMGSPENEPFHADNESPQKEVTVGRFFMAETEITWNVYYTFLAETIAEGRIPPEEVFALNSDPDVDAISGPTPAYGNPEQGWGGGERPAITMTHYSAEIFCRWLSEKTGKTYRLPTEAEWEYAARGGTDTPYFFEGSPKKYSETGLWNKVFGADTTVINTYTIYAGNSNGRTGEPSQVKPNLFGLRNMLGNVWEYTSDTYEGAQTEAGGAEYVIRGGTYADDASGVRSAVRGATQHDLWLRTDPQQPKSIWWYSDIKAIGFRVVMEPPAGI